jgi:hypothetical protein
MQCRRERVIAGPVRHGRTTLLNQIYAPEQKVGLSFPVHAVVRMSVVATSLEGIAGEN